MFAASHTRAAAVVIGGAAAGTVAFACARRCFSTTNLTSLVKQGRKAVCIGKNYSEHIAELSQLGPEWTNEGEPEPVIFLKPTSSYAFPGEPLVLPRRRSKAPPVNNGVHHEVELAVVVGKALGRHDGADALDDATLMARHVAGYCLALDMTERDEQTAAKNKGMPWSVAKGYDTFLPLSNPFTLRDGEAWQTLHLWLDVNGVRRQECDAGVMIHSIPALLRHCSKIMTLEPGDLLLTGTPKGVGRVVAGDRITAGVVGHVEMAVEVQDEV